MTNRLPRIYFCIKFENQTKVKWFKSKKNRSKIKLMQYFRGLPSFKWGKVYDAKTKQQLFWFNRLSEGVEDRRTVDKWKN